MTKVKICGIKTMEQSSAALDAGAEFLGFVFYRPSHRYVDCVTASRIIAACRATHGDSSVWQAVGVFVDEERSRVDSIVAAANIDIAQLCGDEDAEYCRSLAVPVLRAVHVGADGATSIPPHAEQLGAWRLLLDTKADGMFGGTGRTYPWTVVREPAAEGFVAGGLTVQNVSAAIEQAHPWAVDVSGGVERNRVKDARLMRDFIEEVRRVDRHAGR
jgi:phosphoribosylanthranilate isomerase